MKKVIIGFILVAFGVILSVGVFAQPPRPPADKGTVGNQPPAGAPTGTPIEPGTGVLLILAAAYGFKKVQVARTFQN
jgi:hypothetical protein